MKKIAGVGVNDANYKTQRFANGKLVWRCPYYAVWTGMINRCYSQSLLKRNPSYIGVTVCEDWHLFSNFLDWMKIQDWKGKQLDKDIKSGPLKIYSPNTCCFVDAQRNAEEANAKKFKFNSPDGVNHEIYNLRKFCRDNDLNYQNMSNVANKRRAHHKGWTLT